MILVFILFGIKLIPQFQYTFAGIFWSLAYQGIFVIWFVLSVFRSGFWFRYLKKYLKNWVLWIGYLAIIFLSFSNTQLGFFSLNLTFWEPIIIYYYYMEILKDGEKEANIITFFCMVSLLVGLLQSIQSVNVNELAAREASSGHSSDDAMLTGNYSFTATLTILLPTLYIALISKIPIFWKSLVAVFIGATFYFIIYCNLMISILCLFLTIPIIFIFDNNIKVNTKKVLKIYLIVVFFLISGIIGRKILILLLEEFAELVNSIEINNKVVQLVSLLNGSVVGNIKSRFGLVAIAWNTFLNNPFLGIGPQNNAQIYFKTFLGMHATLFDDIARYGIVGMGIMVNVYRKFFKNCAKVYGSTNCIRALKTSVAIYIIISMLNPTISANIGIILFFVIPTLLNKLSQIESV